MIFSNELSSWKSARIIAQNLLKAYSKYLQNDFNSFQVQKHGNSNHLELLALAKAIFHSKPERIIFTDDVVRIPKFLIALNQVYGEHDLPPIYFHLYGNFTLQTTEWIKVESILKKTPIHFVLASERQAKLVLNFFKGGQTEVSVCPFPVDTELFAYSQETRSIVREKYTIRNNEIVFFYSGRLCSQKNITRLIKEFALFQEKFNLSARLLLAGKFEDGGTPFKLNETQLGDYYQQYLKALADLSPSIRESIHYMGLQNDNDLRGLYSAADIFVSLSLYHDEDYGMAPAEALCCGLPILLTNWGGYSGFKFSLDPSAFNPCQLIDVSLKREGLVISSESFQTSALHITKKLISDNQRLATSQEAIKRISIDAIADQLRIIHSRGPQYFEGFSELMIKHSRALKNQVVYSGGPKKGAFYEKVYHAYLEPLR